MSYLVEVIADNSGKFVGNAVRLATEKEAKDYGWDLASRFTLVRQTRILTSDDPVNYSFLDGRLEAIQ